VQKQAPSGIQLLTMVVFALSCFGLLLFLWLSFGGPVPLKPQGYRVEVSFPGATQLAEEAEVRASGVEVGKVRDKYQEANRTVAVIELEPEYAPLRSNANARLRQKTLLGETFVELTLGTKDATTVPEGGRLDSSRVQPDIQLDEILDSLDPYTRQAFRTWQQDLGASVEGRGQDLNDAFGNLPAFVEAGGDLFQELDEQREAVGALVRNTGVVFGALTEREAQLRRMIVSQDEVFSGIAEENESFAEIWRIFPTFLEEQRLTMARLESFSEKALPLVRDMQPVLADLGPALDAVGDFGPHLRRFFVNFDPLITISRRSLPATSEVLRGLKPVLNELGPFLQEVNPILEMIGIHIYTLSDMFANLGGATAATMRNPTPGTVGHYLRQFGPQGAETFSIHPNRLPSNRGNTYWKPLGVLTTPKNVRLKMLPNWDCNNAGGERPPGGSPTVTPGCHVQEPWGTPGKIGRYPRLTRDDYGSQSSQRPAQRRSGSRGSPRRSPRYTG
jgi:phospholipid/cholesterol/gamma-HCH transport system substrate-binding protein